MIPLNAIESYRHNGTGNIAKTFHHTVNGIRVPFVLSTLRVVFNSGTGTANLVIGTDSYSGSDFDFPRRTLPTAGPGATNAYINLGTEDLQAKDWIFRGNPNNANDTDGLTIAWTDPDAATWAVEVELVALSDVT